PLCCTIQVCPHLLCPGTLAPLASFCEKSICFVLCGRLLLLRARGTGFPDCCSRSCRYEGIECLLRETFLMLSSSFWRSYFYQCLFLGSSLFEAPSPRYGP